MGLGPPDVVTLMSTVPVPAGEVALIWPGLMTENDAAGVLPKVTAKAPEKFEPVMVTPVPPAAGPLFGLTLLIAGGEICARAFDAKPNVATRPMKKTATKG